MYLFSAEAQVFVEDITLEDFDLVLDQLGKCAIATQSLAKRVEQRRAEDLLLEPEPRMSSLAAMMRVRVSKAEEEKATNLSSAEQSFLGRMRTKYFETPGRSRSIFSSKILPKKPVTPARVNVQHSVNTANVGRRYKRMNSLQQ